VARVRRRRLVQIGIGIELTNHVHPSLALRCQPRHFMAAVALVSGEDELSVGEPSQQETQQQSQQLSRCLVRPAAFQVVLRRTVQSHEYGQSPKAASKGELD
jgi:hypothetical protein